MTQTKTGYSDVFTPMHQTALAYKACPKCGAKALTSNHNWLQEHPAGIPAAKSIKVWFECGSYYNHVQPTGAKTPPVWEGSGTCDLRVDNQRHVLMAEAAKSQEDFSRLRPMADAAERTAQVLRVPVADLVSEVERLVAKQNELEEEKARLQSADS